MSDRDNDRQNGEDMIREIFGEAYFQRSQSVSAGSGKQDIRDLGYEVVFGRLYRRPGLDTRDRLLCAIAVLTVLKLEKQLAVYVAAARNTGIEASVIKEVILLMTAYGGFPAALNAMSIADDVCNQEVNQETPKDRDKGS